MTLDEMVDYLGLEEEYTMVTLTRLVQRKLKLLTWFSKYLDKGNEILDKYNHIYSIIQKEYPEYII